MHPHRDASALQPEVVDELQNGLTLIRHPFHGPDQDITVSESMLELYLEIWKECTWTYYLYCETLDQKDVSHFQTMLYRNRYP
jgi:hypothetical protein